MPTAAPPRPAPVPTPRAQARRAARRRVVAATLAVVLGALGVALSPPAQLPASADPPTTGSTIVTETFQGDSVLDPAWQALGAACLTGRPAGGGAGVIPDCAPSQTGPVPPTGVTPGYLQLTDTQNYQAGSILYNRPIPATAGISVTFEQYQYGGNGADGIGFYLVDGSTDLTATGGLGGSLGYAQRHTEPGVTGGYVGVGLDGYGNYYGDGEDRGRLCPAGQQSPQTAEGANAPNVVTVRGPGAGLDGYCWQGATVVSPTPRPQSTLAGTLRANTQDPVVAKRTVNVQVTPAPSPRIIVEVRYTDGGPWVRELDIPAPPNPPSTYKLGISASTGGLNDVHLVRTVTVDTILPLAALQLEKQVDRSGPPLGPELGPGDTIPYVYTVTNAGQETIEDLRIVDDRLPGLTDVTCDLTTLVPAPAAGSTAVCRGTYTITSDDAAAGSVTNVAFAAGVVDDETAIVSNQASTTVPLVSSLALTKAVVTSPPYAVGQQVQYGYEVTNTGGSTLTTVGVTDDRVSTAGVVCQADVLAPTESTTCTGTYVVRAEDVGADGWLVNTAQAHASTPIGQGVLSDPADERIPVFTDVGVTKTVDQPAPLVGTDVTFTITATNNGPSAATNVVLRDQLPAGRLTYVSHTTSAGTYDPTAAQWQIPALAVGGSATLTLVATVNTNTEVANSVTRTSMTQTDIDPSNDSASVTLNPVTPTTDIAVLKSVVGPDDVPLGSTAQFRVTARNDGPSPATGLVLRDVLPSGLTLVSATPSQGTVAPDTGLWTVGALAVGASATLDLVVEPQSIGRFVNVARLEAVSPTDVNPGNNQASATITARAPQADLAVVKGVLPASTFVGDTVTFSATVTNLGPETVHDIRMVDDRPDGITVLGAEASQGTIDVENLTWDVGTLAPGASARATLTATIDTEGSHTNTVTVGAPNLVDPTPENNTDTATVTTQVAPLDLGVTKSVASDTGAPLDEIPLGETVTFTISATHTPDPEAPDESATDVVLLDTLPAGLTYVSSTGDGAFDPATGRWTFDTIAPGATVTREIVARADVVGQQINSVSLSHVAQRDTDPTNNSATASITVVEEADLAVSKTVETPRGDGVAQPGEIVTYTIGIGNLGPNDDDSVEVVDPLPIAADIVGFRAPDGTTFDQAARVWTVGSLAVGQEYTLEIDVRVSTRGGSFRNEVVNSQARLPDPDLSNNSAFATLFVPVADVVVTKTVDDPAPFVGDEVTFTVGVANSGPDRADAVMVADLLPDGLTFVSATPSTGTYDAGTGVWTVGDLDPRNRLPGDAVPQATLTVVAHVDRAGTFDNTAASDRTDAFPFDPDLANNSASATVVAAVLPTDVGVTKTATPSSVGVGGEVRFALTVTVSGPGAAADVVVVDALPEGLTPVSAGRLPDGDACTVTGQDVVCLLGDLAPGDAVDLEVVATGDVAGTHTNTATVSTTSPEEVLENNTASADVTVVAPPTPPGPGPGPGPEPGPGPGPGGHGPGSVATTGADGVAALLVALALLALGTVLLVGAVRGRRGVGGSA
ncbi:CARDB domain-containing protein [Cellulosimicrobium sp. SH8]|uniref:DUF7507 domain-containing protein n=1 Tax=Cellulosimicrobium sp. SH8 TaxID=2952936 RepID=UPI0021F33B65|nr:CARDB domain-containing protein [Cellulosimicrobium sp. SH8]